jgi:hypothetical protein
MTIPQVSNLPLSAAKAGPMMSHFASTGVPGLTGGFAYPPGSDMASFMDNINNTVTAATRGPNGGSVVDWANGLAAQAAQKKAAAAANPLAALTSTGGAQGGIAQIFQMLMAMIAKMGNPTTPKPTTQMTTTHKPTTPKPTAHKTTTHKPTTHKPTTPKPTTHKTK